MSAKKTQNGAVSLTAKEFRSIAKALSDPRRYDILRMIAATKECTCMALREEFPISPATMSHHLKELESAGLITIPREGKYAYPTFRREVWNAYLSKLTEL